MFSDGLLESTISSARLDRSGLSELLKDTKGLVADEIVRSLDPVTHGAQQRDDLAIVVARVELA